LNRLPTRNGQSYSSEGAISPLQEKPTDHWQLDMNLDDMEGIVDPNLANAPAPPSGMFRGPAASGQTTVTESTQGSMLFRDAMDQSSSFATTVSSGSGSWGPTAGRVAETPDRSVLSEAHRQLDTLIMRNPFGSSSSAGSVDNKPRTPPSPHTLSPKYSLPPTTQPRRPSQLRNVKMGSTDSESSNADMHYSGALQPLAPAWATSGGSSQTVFNDPFGSSVPSKPSTADGMSPSRPSTRSAIGTPVALHDSAFPGPTHGRAGENDSAGASGTAAAAAAAAAWAAPESWGVEGDEVSPEDSSSSEDEEDWGRDDATSPSVEATPGKVFRPQSSPSVAKRPPPFGFKSAQPCQPKSRGTATRPGSSSRPRVKTSSGRPSTATRPATGRPGTSGSAHISMMPVS